MDSNYKLTFSLKQHTPLIHFQADQDGATLRASELKPKLDRFLIERLEMMEPNTNKRRKQFEKWFLNDIHQALDYKVKINSTKNKIEEIKVRKEFSLPNYFANMGDEYKKTPKHLVMATAPIEVTIHSFNTELIKCLKEQHHLKDFFMLTNFGTRQSKGFGSFSLLEQKFNKQLYDLWFDLDIKQIPQSVAKTNEHNKDWTTILKLFGSIEIFYKSLRSGINETKGENTLFYLKPAIFFYSLIKLKKQWDKKSIKERYYPPKEMKKLEEKYPDSEIIHFSDTDHPHILIKDLLGLSSSERWGIPFRKEVTKSHRTIDRFQSPLLFKPFEIAPGRYKIGIKTTEIPEKFLNQEFDIAFGRKKGLKLKTPKQFKWADFWTFYFSSDFPDLDNRCDHDIPNYQYRKEYKVLQLIHQQLQSPYKNIAS